MSESGGMNVNRLTAGGQNVATDVKGNITTLPANLRPTGATTAMNLTWDSDNKLRSADIDANGTADVNFQYDALGRRVARSGTGGSVVFVQMDQQTIADYPVGGAATTPTFRYVFASYIDEPVVRKTAGTGGTLVYFHRNQQYSVTAVTTSAGAIAERYAYSAYGQPTILDAAASVLSSSAINNRYTYTGREWDATLGLHHFRARWMSSIAGSFLGRDPIGYDDALGMYTFVNNRPTFYTDPTGLKAKWPDPPSCDACCCCPISLTGAKSDPIQANRRYGITITVTVQLEYRSADKSLLGGERGSDCWMNWYEWSTAAPWYDPAGVNKWLDARAYKDTAKSEVFDDYLNKPRPTKCPPSKTLTIRMVDKPLAENVDATYRQTSWIAIRYRGGGAFCKPACSPNDLYLIINLDWAGNGNAPRVTFNSNPNSLDTPPGLPEPHF